MAIDSSSFRRALGQFASGVTVVTTKDTAGTTYGLTVSAFSSVSLDPPLVLICVDNRSSAHAGFGSTSLFGISVLSQEQEALSRRFARGGSEKFVGLELETGAHGMVLVPGALAQLECRIVRTVPAGDHTIYLGEVLALAATPGAPLVYHASSYTRVVCAVERTHEPEARASP
jgi:flavin reductase (DIM6/NTAB) family NADH-FMN oxidoreductase RutF